MRSLLDLIEHAFGSASLSRVSPPDERVTFAVLTSVDELDAARMIVDRFPEVAIIGINEPKSRIAKPRLLCRGERIDAEAITRALKMARLENSVVQYLAI